MFAEGAQGFFHTFLMVLNPNAEATTATVTFLPEAGGGPVVRSFPMAPMSRLVVDGGSVPEIANRSFGIVVEATQPIVAERAMYFGDHAVARPGRRSRLGGRAGCVQRRGSSRRARPARSSTRSCCSATRATTPANVTLTYLLDNGTTLTASKIVPALGRLTVDVESDAPALASAAFATRVTSDVPIVAERAMYWAGDPAPWTEVARQSRRGGAGNEVAAGRRPRGRAAGASDLHPARRIRQRRPRT